MELLAGVDVARSTLVDVGALAREPVALPAVVALAFEAPIEVRALGVGVTRTALSALIDVVAICAVAAEPGVARACERPIGIRASSVGGARDGRSFALQDVGAGRVRGIIVVRIARISHLARARRASNGVVAPCILPAWVWHAVTRAFVDVAAPWTVIAQVAVTHVPIVADTGEGAVQLLSAGRPVVTGIVAARHCRGYILCFKPVLVLHSPVRIKHNLDHRTLNLDLREGF
mmetsp:Transcript_3761/g.5543  ORF Transcript_3761/g.5543 Transcript_3761/m.5543 type:complete len:232 (+) Transcript_3761:1541-2236(+)